MRSRSTASGSSCRSLPWGWRFGACDPVLQHRGLPADHCHGAGDSASRTPELLRPPWSVGGQGGREWQSLKLQEYRYELLVAIARFWEMFGVRRPVRSDPPAAAGDYDHALHVDHPAAPPILSPFIQLGP